MPIFLLQADAAAAAVLSDHTTIGINEAGQLYLKQPDSSVQVIASATPSTSSQTNDAGTTTVVPTQPLHSAQVEMTGTLARTGVIALDTANPIVGAVIDLTVIFPDYAAIPDLLIEVRDTDAGGTLLASFNTGGDQIASAFWSFVYRAGQWNLKAGQVPAF